MALLEDSLIAHYKMNENTAGDNAELVTNGDFAAWTADNPDDWTVVGEAGSDPEISQVGTGEGHGGVGTGMCNIYTSDGTAISMTQTITLVVGRRYKFSMNVDTKVAGNVTVTLVPTGFGEVYLSTGIKVVPFIASSTSAVLTIKRTSGATDATVDDVSIKLCAIEDSSGNDHDATAQRDSDVISVAGKINTALEFNGSSDYIEIPDHNDFSPALTPFSVSAWINVDFLGSFVIASKGVYNTDGEWSFRFSSSKIYMLYYDESVASCFIGRGYNTALTSYLNQWIHLVTTYDGGILSSGIKIYLNGLRVDDINNELNAASFVSVENLAHDVWIGRYSTTYSNGTIDNVMFFNKELTPLEVQRLYNSGAGVETIPIGIHLSRTGQQFSSSPMN